MKNNRLPQRIRGKVRHGDTRGRELGYPTANMRLHKPLKDGVYISRTCVDGVWHESLTFLGAPKQFESTVRRAETTILDFSANLYDQWITVELLQRIRGNEKFTSVAKLKQAMKNDEKAARTFFQQK